MAANMLLLALAASAAAFIKTSSAASIVMGKAPLDLDRLARHDFRQRVRADVLAHSRGFARAIKKVGLSVAGFGPKASPPLPDKLPPLPPPDVSLSIVVGATVCVLLLIAAVSRRHAKSSQPLNSPAAPSTLSYGGFDPLISVAFRLLNTTGDGRLTLPQLTEGSKTMWDVAAPALGEILGMKADRPGAPVSKWESSRATHERTPWRRCICAELFGPINEVQSVCPRVCLYVSQNAPTPSLV